MRDTGIVVRAVGAGATLLHLAAAGKGGDKAAVLAFISKMLGRGAAVDATTEDVGTSPLQCAVWEGDSNIDISRLLLENGAAASARCLMQAEGWRVRALLLDHGAVPTPQRRETRKGTGVYELWFWHDDHRRPAWFSTARLPGWGQRADAPRE